jgi:hypothetical protein
MLPSQPFFSPEQVSYYSRVAGWSSEKVIALFCEWLDLEEGAQGDLDLEHFLLSKLSDAQLDRVCLDALRGFPLG